MIPRDSVVDLWMGQSFDLAFKLVQKSEESGKQLFGFQGGRRGCPGSRYFHELTLKVKPIYSYIIKL